jgi:Ca-activated chloride channel family protein
MGATLVTVAKDVKLQVEFNPDAVQAYRLIGYENRLLRDEEFNDDRKDAGDMGAGHSVTALYEVVPADAKLDVKVSDVSPLRYQRDRSLKASRRDELAYVKVRYKAPRDSTSQLISQAIVDDGAEAATDLRFAMAVAGYGMLLRDSPHRGRLHYDDVIALARGGIGDDPDHYRREFVEMVRRTASIASLADARRPREQR